MEDMFSMTAFNSAIQSLQIVKRAVPLGAQDGLDHWHFPTSPQREWLTVQIQTCVDKVQKLVSSLKDIQNEMTACYEEYNARVPVGSIPPEILNRIFELIYAESPRYLRHVTHVCSHWRSVGVNNPKFWTRIRVDRWHRHYEEYVPTMLQRSQTLPLSVHLENAKHASIRDATRLAMREHRRVEKLRVSGAHAIRQALSCPYQWDALKVLEIYHSVEEFRNPTRGFTPQSNERRSFPQLQSLVLVEVGLRLLQDGNFGWSNSIRSLCVTGLQNSISASTWAIMLSDLPQLQELTIDHRVRGTDEFRDVVRETHRHVFASFAPITLSCLRRLKMTVWSPAEMEVFGRIEHPADTDATIDVRWHNVGDPTLVLERVLDVVRSKVVDTTIRRSSISVSSDKADIALYQTTTSPPFIKFLLDVPALGQALFTIETVYGLSEVEVLQFPLDYMVSSKEILLQMMNVRTLEVPHLNAHGGLELLCGCPPVFPHVEDLVVRTPDLYTSADPLPVGHRRHNLVNAIVDLLESRKDLGHPIKNLFLGPHSGSTHCLKEVRDTMPEVNARMLPE